MADISRTFPAAITIVIVVGAGTPSLAIMAGRAPNSATPFFVGYVLPVPNPRTHLTRRIPGIRRIRACGLLLRHAAIARARWPNPGLTRATTSAPAPRRESCHIRPLEAMAIEWPSKDLALTVDAIANSVIKTSLYMLTPFTCTKRFSQCTADWPPATNAEPNRVV